MEYESRPVLFVKSVKNAIMRRLPAGARNVARDRFHRLRLRLGSNPLGKPDEHQLFLLRCAPRLFDGAPRPLVYLEFGVYQGASMAASVRAFEALGIADRSRFVGFDSFEGLPPGSEAEGWGSGWFVTSRATAEWNLRRLGVLRRVQLVEGWFDETCTPERAADIGRVDIVMFDCDLYSATTTAIRFVEPLIDGRCLFIFDDYLAYNAEESADKGQVKALDELRRRRPDLSFERLGRVGHCGVGFLVTTVKVAAPPEQPVLRPA